MPAYIFPPLQQLCEAKVRDKESLAKIKSLERDLDVEKVKSSTAYVKGAEGLIQTLGDLEATRSRVAQLEEVSYSNRKCF